MSFASFGSGPAGAQTPNPCGAEVTGGILRDAPRLTSTGGVLALSLAVRRDPSAPPGTMRMCYAYSAVVDGVRREGLVPPTLAVHPGDRIALDLINALPATDNGMPMSARRGVRTAQAPARPPREPGEYHLITNYTNVHFHGLNVSPIPPGDNVTTVLVPPGSGASTRYVIDIPKNEPGGLYWYHPHVHGEAKSQVKAGLTGGILIEPLGERVDSRVLVVRGVDAPVTAFATAARKRAQRWQSYALSVHRGLRPRALGAAADPFPFAPPAECPPPSAGAPNSEFLTVNGSNVPEPGTTEYPLPSTTLEEGQPQVWHIANTAAITYLDLALTVDGRAVPLQLVGRDGIPVGPDNGGVSYRPIPLDHVLLAPAGRADVLIAGPQAGHTAVLATRRVDTGCAGDTDGARDLVAIRGVAGPTALAGAARAPSALAGQYEAARNTRFANLTSAQPVRRRRFAFTEYPLADGSRTDFYITELSNPSAYEHPYHMLQPPSVVAKSGTTEDWVIENWTQEIHAFHIHQIHFAVLAGLPGVADGLGMLLDTVNVPFGGYVVRNGGREFVPGAVRLRMDFRDPQIVGDFVYHCHVLEHEDNGMMAVIRVEP